MKARWIEIIIIVMALGLLSLCFAGWDATKPSDSDAIYGWPASIRTNWDALEAVFGVDLIHSSLSNYIINVQDPPYNADPTGVADSTAEIQAAIDAAEAASGGLVFFPTGTYSLGTGLTIENDDVSLYFVPGASLDWTGSAIGTILTVGDGIAIQYRNNIENLQITHTTVMTGGTAIKYQKGGESDIRNITITGAFNPITFDTCSAYSFTTLRNFRFFNTVANGTGILISGATSAGDIKLVNGLAFGPAGSQPAYGIRITTATGPIVIDTVDTVNQGIGLYINPIAGGGLVSFVDVKSSSFDSGTDGIRFAAEAVGSMAHIRITDCWTSSNSDYGINFTTDTIGDVVVKGHISVLNGLAGLRLAAQVDGLNVTASTFNGNSVTTPGTYPGILVEADISKFRIVNNTSGYSIGGYGVAITQNYGIEIKAGTSADFIIAENDFRNNDTGGILNGGTGSNQSIRNNLGHKTENSGTATLLNANTSVVVAHGLGGATPTVINITWRENPTNVIADWWIDTIGVINFTLNGVDPGASNLDFGWEAKVR